jgi:very-short-patch-repair endonuclease
VVIIEDRDGRGMLMRPERDPLLRDQVTRLLGVLRQLAVAKNAPIRHTARYDAALWLAEVRDHGTVKAPEGPGDELLRVARVPREPEPPAPAGIDGWIRRPPDSDAVPEPELHDQRHLDRQDVLLADVPEVAAEFDAWLRDTWRPWAERERLARPRSRVFEALFELGRLAADRPESVELVLAAGLLHAPGDQDEDDVHVHLISQPVLVEQDPRTGEVVCRLVEDQGMRLEDDELLSGLALFDPSGSAHLRDRLLELAETPVAAGVATFCAEWAPRALTTACVVEDSWTPPSGARTRLAVAPAVVARRRGAFALRGYYDSMAASVADPDVAVPLGLAQLVRAFEAGERLDWLERAGASAAADLAADPLFPLPANEEQGAIISRLGGDTGVVVEGPPGTGKTHTIANLVSALLAKGQRVLVTSEKAQALRVLRDKLPPDMQQLCVSITDASPKGNSDLAQSVATMAAQHSEFTLERSDRTIADLTAQRAAARADRARLLAEIRALRESETVEHPEVAPGFGGTLARIASTIAGTAGDGWVSGAADTDLPLPGPELAELLELQRGDTPARRARRGQRLPAAAPMPAAEFARRVASVRAGEAVRTGADGPFVAALERLDAEVLPRLEPLSAELAEAVAQLRSVPGPTSWALRSADMLLAGHNAHVWQRAVEQLPLVDLAVRHDRDADFAVVQVAPSVDPAQAMAVYERLAAYLGRGAGMRRMFKAAEQRDAERFGDAVRVDGAVPLTATAAAAAAHHLRFLMLARRFDAAFAPLAAGLDPGATRQELLQTMLDLRRACDAVHRVLNAAGALRAVLAALPPPARPTIGSTAALERVAAVALTVTQARSAALAQAELDGAAAGLVAAAGPAPERAPETLALAEALRGRDPEAYARAVDDLDRARAEQCAQHRCDDLLERLAAASPALAAEVRARPADPVWAERLGRWPQAWARARAVSWLAERTAPGREQRLDGELDAAVTDIDRLTARLAAALAWRACLLRMTAVQVTALQSYRNAVARVGRGTGKFAERYRRDAREAMAVAQAAVPAWVMPIQQVLASVPPRPGSFDVVIVDEASQADMTSTFLLWLAPRVIVVGDDKQCTPSEVASGALQPVFDRIDSELHDLPSYLRSVFTPKDSLFSMLRTRFGQVVRLREHFRCMPEIITWPSTSFYRDAPLIPLRQFGADRLPPLRHTLVPGAEVEGGTGRVVNRAEATALAATVRACLDDPAYAGRTVGVVVLQSSQAQVDLISHELRLRVAADEWEARRIRVGIAPDFQGDERHVVFLSMVAAPNAPLRALTAETYRQSYNVAVSRAQDQLWLFHSVTPDRLGRADLRHSLLGYVLGGGSGVVDPVLADVDRDRRHGAFDSLFEQRVFLDLTARGYHVTPQVESNRRRIDLVVTGAAGKLAVECDGEAFHSTPEQRRADLDREQELKRCGWTFERVRESLYYIDREEALAPVWAALDRLGIGPLGEFTDGTWTPLPTGDEPNADGPATVEAPAPADTGTPVPAHEAPTVVDLAAPDAATVVDVPAPDPATVVDLAAPDPATVVDLPAPEPPAPDEAAARAVLLRSVALRGRIDPAHAAFLLRTSAAAATSVLDALVVAGVLRPEQLHRTGTYVPVGGRRAIRSAAAAAAAPPAVG